MVCGVLEERKNLFGEYGMIVIHMAIVHVLCINVKSLHYVEVRLFVLLL